MSDFYADDTGSESSDLECEQMTEPETEDEQ